jgi:hypothetical protein
MCHFLERIIYLYPGIQAFVLHTRSSSAQYTYNQSFAFLYSYPYRTFTLISAVLVKITPILQSYFKLRGITPSCDSFKMRNSEQPLYGKLSKVFGIPPRPVLTCL